MKIGRNEPCPCGSGLKYKKCCLRKHEEARGARYYGSEAPATAEATGQAEAAPAQEVQAASQPAAASRGKVEIGQTCVVQPANPRKTKHRDRQCVVLGFEEATDGGPARAEVKFLDTNRKGKVDVEDLVPVEAAAQ